MLRTLRAFAWLRWRVFMNSLERTTRRDVLQRFSLASEALSSIVVVLIMVPSMAALAALGAYAGWGLARRPAPDPPFESVRLLLLAGSALALAAPVMFPAAQRTNAVRLLLLPIPRGVLYAAQVTTTLTEPWMLLGVAVLVAVPVGLAISGAYVAAATAAVAGMLLVVVLGAIVLVVTSAVDLAVRNRRRGEFLGLVLLLALPTLVLLPSLVIDRQQRSREDPVEMRGRQPSTRVITFQQAARAILPSEAYARATRAAVESRHRAMWRSLLTLAGTAVVLHGIAFGIFARVLGSAGVLGAGRMGRSRSVRAWHIPAVSPGASAVARNQVRLALRTPRGRVTLLMPVVMFLVIGLALSGDATGLQFGPLRIAGGLSLAAVTSFVSLIAIQPLAMNQFAVDRAGLTLVLLLPLDIRSLLAGKAIGNAIVVAIPAGMCTAGSLVLFPRGEPALWLCIPLALAATYLLTAPVAAALSAVFPRSVDLNSIGNASNAHAVAGLLGTVTFLATGAPCLVLVLIALYVLERAMLAPLLLLLWCGVCTAVSTALFRMVAVLVERRRENLGLIG